ncbi:signal recognition particle protein Srp54 [Candidatus Haloredivivus sp. G17]|nr:signal recognition particle protein Srp54 [Candidatus Haloredivivus sp. G17]
MFDRVKESIQKFSSKSAVDEEAVEELVKDIQRDLIAADVDVGLVSDLSDEIREEALEGKKDGLTRKEHVLETVYNKMEELLGQKPEIEIEPQKILLSGLYGAGKTTTAAKLADYYRKRGLKTGLIAADTDRPAAYDQLKQMAEKADSEFYGDPEAENPSQVVEKGLQELDAEVIIVDSAGRNSLDDELKKELSDVEDVLRPDESYLVMPADIGQSAKDQAENFEDAVGITGVIVTKMDSSAKGGGALIACSMSDAQVKFIGTGEQVTDLEVYDPVKYVSEMLGQPNLESLLEKVEELETDPEEMLEGEFTLKEFRQQIESVSETGMMEDLMKQLPFGGKMPDNISQLTEEKTQAYKYIIDSMTDEEINDPSLINKSRTERIASGSGTSNSEVRELIKHYRQTKNMMDKMDKGSMKRGNMQDMMQKLGL